METHHYSPLGPFFSIHAIFRENGQNVRFGAQSLGNSGSVTENLRK